MGDELMPWHKNWLADIEYDRVDLVKEGANSKAHIKLFKSKGGNEMDLEQILKSLKPEHRAVVEKALGVKPEDVEKAKQDAVADIQKERDDLQAELDALKESQGIEKGKSEEEILKSVKDPAVKALLETQIAKAKAAEDEVKKAREAQMNEEAVAKAKELDGIGAEEQQLADVYKKLKNVDQGLCDDVFGIFKAAKALANEGGAFEEVGKSSGNLEGTGDESSAWGKIEAKANEISKSKGVGMAEAISKAIDENPELYDAYIKAQQG